MTPTLLQAVVLVAAAACLPSSTVAQGVYDYRLIPAFSSSKLNATNSLPTVSTINVPLVDVDNTTRLAKGRLITVHDASTFSIYPPLGGCGFNRTQTSVNARAHGCSVATNAGFFDIQNVTNPHCLGTIVSDSEVIQTETIHKNVHWGLTSDNNWFVGYVNDTMLQQHTLSNGVRACAPSGAGCQAQPSWYFTQLSGGVIQLIKDGQPYVNQSIQLEYAGTQTTGTNQYFADVVAGRTAIGVLADGSLGMIQIDGKTGRDGIDLYTLATLMQKLGFQQAINWDGGGSSSTAVENMIVNMPSDACPGDSLGVLGCERAVTTITCIHHTSQQLVV